MCWNLLSSFPPFISHSNCQTLAFFYNVTRVPRCPALGELCANCNWNSRHGATFHNVIQLMMRIIEYIGILKLKASSRQGYLFTNFRAVAAARLQVGWCWYMVMMLPPPYYIKSRDLKCKHFICLQFANKESCAKQSLIDSPLSKLDESVIERSLFKNYPGIRSWHVGSINILQPLGPPNKDMFDDSLVRDVRDLVHWAVVTGVLNRRQHTLL